MAAPTVQAVGTANHGTGAVTYTLPAHAANDILLLVVECSDSAGVTAPTQDSGWAHVTNSPRAQGSNVTCANVMWIRATSGSMTNPQVPTGPNHQIGVPLVVRGCVTSGNPWDFSPVGNGGAAQTSISATGGTTTVADTLVVVSIANNTDTTTNQFSSVANASLGSFTEQVQSFTTDGNGGGIGVYTGTKAAAGATGTTTGTQPSGSYASLVLALKPSTSQDETGTAAASGSGTLAAAGTPSPVSASSLSGSGTLAPGTAVPAASGTASPSGEGVLASVPATAANLVPNPSFETDAAGWGPYNSTEALVRDGTHGGADGSWALKVTDAAGGDDFGAAADAHVPVAPSVPYSVSASSWAPAGVGDPYLSVVWHTSGGAGISAGTVATAAAKDGWARMSAQVVSPATAGRLYVSVAAALGAGESFWVDDVAVRQPAVTAAGAAAPSGDGVLSGTQASATASGSAAPSGEGALAASGAPATSGTGALSGSGSLSVAGTPSPVSDAALSGSGTLSASGAPGTQDETGTASPDGSGALVASGQPIASGASALSGSGTLAAAGTVSGTAALSGSGSLAYGRPAGVVTNLVTTPSFENVPTGSPAWTLVWREGSGNSAIAAGATGAVAGSLAGSTTITSGTSVSIGMAPGPTGVPVTAGSTYTASVHAAASTAGSPTARIALTWSTAGSVFVSAVAGTTTTLTGTPARLSLTATAPATAAFVKIAVNSVGGWLTGNSLHTDAVMVTAGSVLEDYFDGDHAPGDGWDYAWSGSPHNSVLTRTGGATGTPAVTAAASLSGSGSLSAAGAPAPTAAAAPSGSGALSASGSVAEPAALSGSGTLDASGQAFKAIAFDASATAAVVNNTSTVTVNIAAAATGSAVWLWGVWDGSYTGVSMTGSWAELADVQVGLTSRYFLFRHTKLAGESTFVVTAAGDTGRVTTGWVSYTNIDQTTPEESLATASSTTTNQGTVTTASATPASSNRRALAFFGARSTSSSGNTWTPPAGLTERFDAVNGSGTSPWLSITGADSNGHVTQAAHSYTGDNSLLSSATESALLYLRPAPVVIEATGSAAPSGSGGLVASGTPAPAQAVALSGSGALSAAGAPAAPGSAATSGSGTLSATGAPAPVQSVPLSGSGTLATVLSVPRPAQQVPLSGSGALAASGEVASAFTGSGSLSGSGALSAVLTPSTAVTVPLSGTGLLVAAGAFAASVPVPLAGTGTLLGEGLPRYAVEPGLSGSGTLVVTSLPQYAAAVPLSGSGTLVPTGTKTVTNLVPNPSFETSLTGWAVSGGTATRDNTGLDGSWSVLLQGTGAAGDRVSLAQQAGSLCEVAGGLFYTVSAKFSGLATGTGEYGLVLHWLGFAGTEISTSEVGTGPVTGAVIRAALTALAPPGAVLLAVEPFASSSTNLPVRLDSVMATKGPGLEDYFDGSTVDTGEFTYEWSGAPHASPSVRTPADAVVQLSGTGDLVPGEGTAVIFPYAALSGTGLLGATGVASQVPARDITVTGALVRGHSGWLISSPHRGGLLPAAASGRIRAAASTGSLRRDHSGRLLP